jgi:hypothetical protein
MQAAFDFLSGKIEYKKPLQLMFLVYGSTYSTANLTQLYCERSDIDPRLSLLINTSIVNITTIGIKDKKYAEMFGNKIPLFPKKCLCLFAMRDMMTISASFIFKRDIQKVFNKYVPDNMADLLSSFSLPIIAQFLCTPLHIFAFDIYQKPCRPFIERFVIVKKIYWSVCLGRIIRVIPAFCLGGFINDMLRNRYYSDPL